jgi:hypothetical protein
VLCLMLVRHVPQFVAFDANQPALHGSDHKSDVLSPAVSHDQSSGAVVIPAALHTSESSSKNLPKRRVTHAIRHLHQNQRIVPQVVAARWIQDVMSGEINRLIIPVAETVLVIRTTERVGPNAWVSSVYVWRVTWQNAAPADTDKNVAAQGPVAHKT